MFDGHLVLFLNKNGSPLICCIDMPIDFDCEVRMNISFVNIHALLIYFVLFGMYRMSVDVTILYWWLYIVYICEYLKLYDLGK